MLTIDLLIGLKRSKEKKVEKDFLNCTDTEKLFKVTRMPMYKRDFISYIRWKICRNRLCVWRAGSNIINS